MPRPVEHLADVLAKTGQADGTAEIVALVEAGLKAAKAQQDARRAAEGKELKAHPFVTDAGKECERQVVYSLLNYPEEELTTDSLINFAVGSAVEEAFAGMVQMVGGKLVRELRVEIPMPYTVVSGRVDMLLLAPPRRMIELKSTSSRSMGWMLKRGPNAGHVKQLNLYMHASQQGLLFDRDGGALDPFEEGYVVYVVKDAIIREPPIHAFRVDYDPEMAAMDLTRLAVLAAQAQDRDIPDRDPKYEWGKFPCGWCGYRPVCWRGEEMS